MVCQTCGTHYSPDSWTCPALPDGAPLHVCLTCGGAVPVKGIAMHDMWHQNIANIAIESQQRIGRLEANGS
jgi:hypothetical protein